ncbi:MAG: phage protein Gp36 family protein [Myxococcota bacterium]
MANPWALVLREAGRATDAGTTSGADLSLDDDGVGGVYPRSAAELLLEVTAITDGTTLEVAVESSPSGEGSWQPVDRFRPRVAVGHQRLKVSGLERYFRATWTLEGSGAVTFAVTGEAHTCLATPLDFEAMGIPLRELDGIPPEIKARHLMAASDQVLSYVNGAHALPLRSWGFDLRRYTCVIAAYKMVSSHLGYRPDDFDEDFRRQYERLVGSDTSTQTPILELVAAGRIPVVGLVDETPARVESGGVVVSERSRGWTRR